MTDVPGVPQSALETFDNTERRALRDLTSGFTKDHIVGHLPQWEQDGELPRQLHREAGQLGLLGLGYSEEVGGSGGDLRDVVVMTEAMLTAGGSGGLISALFTHGIALPHIYDAYRRDPIQRADLLDIVRATLQGTMITALAVTEPDGGSDVAAIRTAAVPLDAAGRPTSAELAHTWRINGAKAYITSGTRADVVVLAARAFGSGAAGVALFAVPTTTPGFSVVSRMAKMGWHCSDTAELAFSDMDLPAAALLTDSPGAGFASLARHFAVERVTLAVTAYATAQRCLDLTVDWVRQRETFGRPLISRQVVRHQLVEMHRQVDVARSYTRALVNDIVVAEDADDGVPDSQILLRAALAKNTAVAACDDVVAAAVQLHGGYGFLRDAEVERHYRDAKVLGIGGGATEVMTDLAAKLLGY